MKAKGMTDSNSRKCTRCGNHVWRTSKVCACLFNPKYTTTDRGNKS